MEPFWSDRSGVLIARAWREPSCDGVRVRVIWTAEVVDNGTSSSANVVVLDDREAVLALVSGWLARVAEVPAGEPADPDGGQPPAG